MAEAVRLCLRMRWPLLFVFAFLTPSYPAFAYSFHQYEQAPVLVVGRVLEVQLGSVVNEPYFSPYGEVLEATATVEVLRSRSSADELAAPSVGQQILLRIYRYVDGGNPSIGPSPSPPVVDERRTYVFPLRAREGGLWHLAGDHGDFAVQLATTQPLHDAPPPTSRYFLLDEAAGVIVHGAAPQVRDSARGLHDFIGEEQAADFFALLEAAIGTDAPRLARLEALYTFGQPIFGGPGGTAADPPLDVAKWASERLARSPQRARLLAETLLENMKFANRAGLLLEAADQALLVSGARRALQEGRAGALYLTWELLRRNHPELLSEAMARAFEVADDPNGDHQELQLAGSLIGERGSKAEQKTYALLVGKHRHADPAFYNRLWQSVGLENNTNAGYVLAVVLEDQRIAFRDISYADLAAWALQRQTGEDFGMRENNSRFARDRSIARALAWLREHGYAQQP